MIRRLIRHVVFSPPHTKVTLSQFENVDQNVQLLFVDPFGNPTANLTRPGTTTPVVSLRRKLHTPSRTALLFSHGNGSNIQTCLAHCLYMRDAFDVDVYSYDYPGYGLNRGSSTAEGVFRSVEAAYKYVKQQGHTHVVIYGHSLGTAASVHITSLPETEVSGLILESAFKSILQVKLPVALVHILPLDLDMFHNDKNLVGCVPTPVLFIHGSHDNVIPMSHSVDMAASYPSAYVNTCWIAGGGHNNLANHPHFGRAVGAFLEQFAEPAPAAAAPTSSLRVRTQWRTIAL